MLFHGLTTVSYRDAHANSSRETHAMDNRDTKQVWPLPHMNKLHS